MIVKRQFNLRRVWSHIRTPMTFVILWTTLLTWTDNYFGIQSWYVPTMTISLLGSALAIFIAFRNNTAYGRWWEARTAWGEIVSSSRILIRLVITFTDSHAHLPTYDPTRSKEFKERMSTLLIEWVHAVRDEVLEDSFDKGLSRTSQAQKIHLDIGATIYKAMRDGTLAGFDSFQMEGQLASLARQHSIVERIKQTPLLRQYDYFTRLFVLVFLSMLPIALLELLPNDTWELWLAVPLTTIIAGVFVIMERTGAANEDPFKGDVTDVPLHSLCRTIERDVLTALGKRDLPSPIILNNGYLH